MSSIQKLKEIELYAWVGEDELGSGEIGLKQGVVPAGIIPMVSISREKLEKYWNQAEEQAAEQGPYRGKRIHLCRFKLAEIIKGTEKGEPLTESQP